MSVSIRLIGRPEIRVDGEVGAVRGHKPWALLARLLGAERPLGRRQLAGELFPDAEDPLGSLRWSLAALRGALGSSSSLTGDPIRLDLPPGTTVDLWSLAEGEIDDVDLEGTLLESIDPQAGPEFGCWLLTERERVAGLVDAQLRRQVIGATSSGRHDRAIALAQVVVRRRPLEEGAHVLLVSALAAAGRHETAEQQAEAAETLIRDEVGVEASPALRSAARRAIADPPAGVSTAAVARSLLESGMAALSAGAVDAGVECLRRAVAEAERAGDRPLKARGLFELGSALVHSVRGYDDEGAVLLGRVNDLAIELGDAVLSSSALTELGYVDALAGRRPTAADYLDRALESAGGDAGLLAGVHAITGFNLVDWGRRADGLAHYEQSIEFAQSADKPRRLAWALGIGAWGRLIDGDLPGARSWLDQCLEIVEGERWLAFRPWPLAIVGEVDLRSGRDPAAVRIEQEHAFALSVQLGDPCWEGVSARSIALACAASSDHHAALIWIRDAHQRCRRHLDTFVGMEGWILATEARLSLDAGQLERGETVARELLAVAARAHMDDLVSEAMTLIDRSRTT